MRLLDTHTGHFVDFYDISQLHYAILSHTWDPLGEQTYQVVRGIQERLLNRVDATLVELEPPLFSSSDQAKGGGGDQGIPGFWSDCKLSPKIRKACEIARVHGYRYIWIDSCCIDKTSSSELSEAINSMYSWYSRASICYAFLADIPHEDVPDSHESAFRRSRWFRRGWTLQELIAPRRLVFLSSDWRTLGSKSSMAGLVEQITRIDREVLTNRLSLDGISVARRMSWAADRETTRVEDRAYSLIGIFDLNMPTLYGEGDRAFRRLQEEILRRVPDQTLFAVGVNPASHRLPQGEDDVGPNYIVEVSHTETFFSSSPSCFSSAAGVDSMPESIYLHLLGLSQIPYSDYSPTPYGIRATFPIIPLQRCLHSWSIRTLDRSSIADWYLVLLSCYNSSEFRGLGSHLLARVCRIASYPSAKVDIMTVGSIQRDTISLQLQQLTGIAAEEDGGFTIFTLYSSEIKRLRAHIQLRTVYIPHPGRASPALPPPASPWLAHRPLKFVLSSYSSAVLRAAGYDVDFHQPRRTSQSDLPWTHSLVLRRHDCVLQLNINQVPRLFDRSLSAAAWRFTPADAESHRFPLSTCQDPRPHDCVVYSFDPAEGGFPLFTLLKKAVGDQGEGVVFRLELEQAAPSQSASEPSDGSHYLHVDIEELDWYLLGKRNYSASIVQQIVDACSQTAESIEPVGSD